ncbi:XRE family transcriptional regulator [Romboutsia ilealis]|uniref:Helix-turn-helix transcriptional regulator n=1 Tax=Romboutsia faecis TaxID=2764597 RepID=A0ABR7JK42_9FIRM|nr:helix-turn-helix transcriptional regulator [Romboutsia faecis]MBC5995289.1 helix-turn-helix transcriptional regulator [Romboutsia faecis]MRN24466.1 XRE family transcriptional regulator [Romboutsia ilealis]
MGIRILKSKRVLKGLTRVQIEKKMNLNTKPYNHKENGRVKFTLDKVSKTIKILKLTLEEVDEIFLEVSNLP